MKRSTIYAVSRMLFISALIVLPGFSFTQAQDSGNQQLFLPLVVNGEQRSSIFGLEMVRVTAERGLTLVQSSDTQWVRRNALRWKHIEATEGVYTWDAPQLKQLEQEMITASESGINLILVVHGSPRWATSPYEVDCAPINPAKYQRFAAFMSEVVKRYSVPPYNVRYWEVLNEPDGALNAKDEIYGCWGDANDPYFGGEAYGNMLKVVSRAMRAANAQIKILHGGLYLPTPYNTQDKDSLPGRFFEGVLRTGAGNSFDIVSFHSYYHLSTFNRNNLNIREDWRVDYIRDLLAQYNVGEKPLIRTESALLCSEATPECRWAQADFMARLYTRSMRDGLLANVWYVYDSDGWFSGALIEPGDVFAPRPSYFAYRHVATTLSDVRYLGLIEGLPETAEGYRFQHFNGTQTWVVWSDYESRLNIKVPASAQVRCTLRDGSSYPCTNNKGVVSLPTLGGNTLYLTIQ
jgi:hypothetical protein